MNYYNQSASKTLTELSSHKLYGLSKDNLRKNTEKFGLNIIKKAKGKNLLQKIIQSLKEPMLLILLFAWIITVGVNLGKFFKTGEFDVYESLGILFSIMLSLTLTIVMEGKSQKAFEMLSTAFDKNYLSVIREGKIVRIEQSMLTVGDVVIVATGDKIYADGRLIEGVDIKTDESMLTGESLSVLKQADKTLDISTHLAERNNMLYSGTFITSGYGKMVVTAIGENAELGKIAVSIQRDSKISQPLEEKLGKLSKTVSIIGAISASLVFIMSMIKMALTNSINVGGVQDLFVECIILIVSAVPEGLPTTVAISLTINSLKLAKSNALIKKLVASESVGCVSVICSDKTGTLTENKMTVTDVYIHNQSLKGYDHAMTNICINSTANIEFKNGEYKFLGQSTECSLLVYAKNVAKIDYLAERKNVEIINVQPFSSEKKYMATTAKFKNGTIQYIKGSEEVVLSKCNLDKAEMSKILLDIEKITKKSRRVIAFCHCENDGEFIFDGYVGTADPIRQDVKKCIKECQKAKIDVKILTGDNLNTASSIASELGILKGDSQVITADVIDNMTDNQLKKNLKYIAVIARSTPATKLRVVTLLKQLGEVVAVTGDGINDAPAIKMADIGISMGSGSDVTKEASDIVLLDNSFSTIVSAISFGRNIYQNFQRFILFQLTVNLSAMLVVLVSLILGLESPFSATMLLWINIIMDGPPALTLGLEKANRDNLKDKPVSRSEKIVSKVMLIRIVMHSVVIAMFIMGQYLFNFLAVELTEIKATIFSMFVIMQLLNAFNCRQIGRESVFKNLSDNKVMLLVIGCTFVLQIILVQNLYNFFGMSSLRLVIWIKIILLSQVMPIFSEAYKLCYRLIKGK